MIKFENTKVVGLEAAVRGIRNLMNSWDKSDSYECISYEEEGDCQGCHEYYSCVGAENSGIIIGPKDLDLMKRLRNAGTDHRKFMRMIGVYVDITAPLYWWKEFDTYKVGTVANSCSTMHKIHDKEFTLDDFSCEYLTPRFLDILKYSIKELNYLRYKYIHYEEEKNMDMKGGYIFKNKKDILRQMIRLLPSSYNQKRTVMLDYEDLANIYKSCRNNELDEWSEHEYLSKEDLSYENTFQKHAGFCDWIKTLPYSELITGPSLADIPICNEIMREAEARKEE